MQVGLDSDGCNTGLIPGFTVADVASGGDDAGVKSRGVSDCDSGASAEALDAPGLKGDSAVGGSRNGTGPGAGIGVPELALHCTGTPPMLQARGRLSARVLFIGS